MAFAAINILWECASPYLDTRDPAILYSEAAKQSIGQTF